jgi:hypothetical protein
MVHGYDTELTLSISHQRVADLRAAADRDRLARGLRRDGPTRTPWWRRWPGRRTSRTAVAPVLRWP